MAVRHKMPQWRATNARSETSVTSEPCSCQSRLSNQSRQSRLSQASPVALEIFVLMRARSESSGE
jgi:hypothetical protein